MRLLLDSDGTVSKYGDGGYSLYYLTLDMAAMCSACVNKENGSEAHVGCTVSEVGKCADNDPQWCVITMDVNWEDTDLYCAHCSGRIESTYAEDDAEDEVRP